jgi:superfamily I DNA/RNA helicase
VIDIPPLTPQLLGELGEELGGCVFTGENQRLFLSAAESCDVQAAPGNGKTTLLVAKLALLSRWWRSRTQGVCVISHTNVAREEVERRLFTHPSASAFLGYPHFIGTVTAFIDRFIALPYLRGLGWTVQRIDDEVFRAIAGSKWRSKPTLTRFSYGNGGRNSYAVDTWVSGMELADDFECVVEAKPQRLAIRNKGHRQPGPHTDCGAELEELKAEIVNEGFYRFADMTALAHQAMEKCPALVQRIRERFPLVLLDEAQDTSGAQLALLDRLFGEGVAYQRLGDQNQTLYEDEELVPDDYWTARESAIPLNEARRFGAEIAAFSSRLTVRAAQQIEGVPGIPNRRSLILFHRDSIAAVIPAYAGEVRAHWGQNLTPDHDIRAVASRHNPARDARGEWPKTLVDYCPDYRSGKGRQSRPDTLCAALRQAAILNETHSSPAETVDLITAGVVALLRRQGVRDALDQTVGKRSLWSVLASRDPSLPLKLRRLMRDHVVFGNAAWNPAAWEVFCHDLMTLLGIDQAPAKAAASFLEFVEEGAVDQDAEARQRSRTIFVHDGIRIRLGSIHSVKGKTVDAILVVETEVWRGQALADRAMDLGTVLPHAFGVEDRDFSGNVAQLAAATNIFVAVTRPRQVLSCAIRKEATNGDLIAAARDQGWHIHDLTKKGSQNAQDGN